MTQATTEQRKGGLGLTQKIFIGLALGIVLGAYINNVNPAWAEYVRPFSQLFLRLIKMIIAPLIFATLVAGTVLLGLHWLLAVVAFHTDWLGSLVKGHRILLIEDGRVNHEGMRRGSITPKDLAQALRQQTGQTDPARVQRAYLERSGQISVVPRAREPRVVDVSVERGVQTIRIELE